MHVWTQKPQLTKPKTTPIVVELGEGVSQSLLVICGLIKDRQRTRGAVVLGASADGVLDDKTDRTARDLVRRAVAVAETAAQCLFDRAVSEHPADGRHQLIHFGVGHFEHTPHVANGRLRLHGPECDDLRNKVLAVFMDDVVDDLIPAIHAEVHVDVGKGHTLRIQEPFEEQ